MTDEEQPTDHVKPDDGVARSEPTDLEKNVKEKRTWMRLLFMILMGIGWSIAGAVTSIVILVNFFFVLFTGKTNARLTEFGQSLATYLYQIVRFMTFNSESRPFPIDDDWPSGKQEP